MATEMLVVKVKDVGAYSLMGAVMAHTSAKSPETVEDEIQVYFRSLSEEVDLVEEISALREKFPKAKLKVSRNGSRELWK